MAFTKNQITLENRLPPGLYQALLYDDRLVFLITTPSTQFSKTRLTPLQEVFN